MAGLRTLDTDLTQVLIDFFEDDFNWHHRVLLIQVAGTRWVVATPDLDVEVTDLSTHRVLPLQRASAFPARVAGNVYVFDPFEDDTEDDLVNRGLALARIMGVAAPVRPGQVAGRIWRVADPARIDFDTVVSGTDMSHPERAVIRGTVGLLQREEDEEDVWIMVERVADNFHDEWLEMKRSGPGRDLRVASGRRDASGDRFSMLKDSMASYRPTAFKDWPFPSNSPSAVQELFPAVQKAGCEIAQYHQFWQPRSGVTISASIAYTHKNLFSALSLFQSYDQIDCYNSAGVEFLCRWILMTQQAVRRSPKAPDFSGLDTYLAHSYDETGGAVTSKFARYIADEKKNEAVILKQTRLWQEEQDSEKKKRDGKHNKNGGGADPAKGQ